MSSLITPGDKVLVPMFGRFGHLLAEIASRAGGDVVTIEAEWGQVFDPGQIAEAVRREKPRVLALVHGDTSTTMAQPFEGLGEVCRETGTLFYSDTTASLTGNPFHVTTLAWTLFQPACKSVWPGRPALRPSPCRTTPPR